MMLKPKASHHNYQKLLLEFRRRISQPTGLLFSLVFLLVFLSCFFFFIRPQSAVAWNERPTVAQWEKQYTGSSVKNGSSKLPAMAIPPPIALSAPKHAVKPQSVVAWKEPPAVAQSKEQSTGSGVKQGSSKPMDVAVPPPISVSAPKRAVMLPNGNGSGREFNCSARNACRKWQPTEFVKEKWDAELRPACPSFFGFIKEDLKPWRETGITLDMVERAKRTATFRLVILKGRMYIRTYSKSYQTRDLFTIWGFIQLMEKYGAMLPDLDLMFDCVDWPIIRKVDANADAQLPPPPPLFRYCGDENTLDIAFPDWSFWGWAEVVTRPWDGLLNDIHKGFKKLKWEDRDPTAFWKGNPFVAPVREDLMKCNHSDWNARIYSQDWIKESGEGYKNSKLPDQCHHRYKIYVEGSAWSVSLKNILACNSPTLMVRPLYYDFFSRGLMPLEHYWPVRLDRKCESIKFAVDWGNNHTDKAKAIGKAGSSFMRKELQMSNVYDYMFHLLTEYAKLMKYKPVIPKGAKEVCSESIICSRRNRVERRFMRESMLKGPSETGPCNLHIDHGFLKDWNERKAEAIKQVEDMEERAWRDLKSM